MSQIISITSCDNLTALTLSTPRFRTGCGSTDTEVPLNRNEFQETRASHTTVYWTNERAPFRQATLWKVFGKVTPSSPYGNKGFSQSIRLVPNREWIPDIINSKLASHLCRISSLATVAVNLNPLYYLYYCLHFINSIPCWLNGNWLQSLEQVNLVLHPSRSTF